MKEQRWELTREPAPIFDYSILLPNLQIAIFSSYVHITSTTSTETLTIELEPLLPLIETITTTHIEILVCGLNTIYLIELYDLKSFNIRRYPIDKLILYFKFVESGSVAIIATNELFYVKLQESEVCESYELKSSNMFSFLRRENIQTIALESIYYNDYLLLLTLDSNGKMQVWNLFSLQIIKTITLSEIEITQTPMKLISVYDLNTTKHGFAFKTVLHLPFVNQPAFQLLEFRFESGALSYMVLDIIECDNVSDFKVVTQRDEYILHVCFQDSMAYSTLDKLQFFPHDCLKPLKCQLNDIYLNFTYQCVLMSLDVEQIEDYSNEVCLDYINRYLHEKTIDVGGDYEDEFFKQTHWLLSLLIENQMLLNQTCSMFYDENLCVLLMSKRGTALGVLRDLDVSEVILFNDSSLLVAPADHFRGTLVVLKDTRIRNSLFHLNALVDYVLENALSLEDCDDVSLDLTKSWTYEIDLDEFAFQVYERIRLQEVENYPKHHAKIKYLLSKVGPIEDIMKELLVLFQHPDLLPEHDEFASLSVATCVSTTLEEIIRYRYNYIKNLYFTLIILKHLSITNLFSKTTFALWQSLLCNYIRLHWLSTKPFQPKGLVKASEFKGKTLLLFLINQQIKFKTITPIEENLVTMALSVLEKLRWSVCHPATSLEDAAPVIKVSNWLINYCPLSVVEELLDMIPSKTASYCVLVGRINLYKFEIEKAKNYLLKGVTGVGKESDLDLVCSPESLQSIEKYYEGVMRMCAENGCFELAVYFGKLCMTTDELKQIVFAHALDCSDFQSAYTILYKIEDETRQKNCVRTLVTELCIQKEISLLVCSFSFTGMTLEVEDSLLFKARNENCGLEDSHYYKICYSYFVYRGDFRKAAEVMYMHADKLLSMDYSAKISDLSLATVWTRISQCLLTSVGALELVDKKQQFLKVTKSKTFVVDVDDIRKQYHLSIATLTLVPKVSSLKSFSLPDPHEIYSIYSSRYMFDQAIQTASMFDFSLKKVVTSVIDALTLILHNKSLYYEYEIQKTGDLKSQIWKVLETILKKHDNPNLELTQLAIKLIISKNPGYALPLFLTGSIVDKFPEFLVRAYLEGGENERAVDILVGVLEKERKVKRMGVCSRWVPLGLVKQVMRDLKEKRLEKAWGEYSAEILACSN